MPRAPMNEETRAKARTLFEQGLSRNKIAEALDLDPATITRWARREGLEFDRSNVAAANVARSIDLAAGRTRLAEKMLAASEAMLDAIDKPYLVYSFGGRDNTYAEHELDSAPVEVRRNIITTAAIAFDKLSRIVEKDSGGLDEAVGMLDALADGFKDAAARYRAETPDAH